MSLPVVLTPLAAANVRAIRDGFRSPRAAVAFGNALSRVIGLLEAMPELYGVHPDTDDVRAARLRRTNYVVYYRVRPDRVEVFAVIDGRRHSSAWQSQLPTNTNGPADVTD